MFYQNAQYIHVYTVVECIGNIKFHLNFGMTLKLIYNNYYL
jgi:hypothetical protein